MIGTRWTFGDRGELWYPLADGSVCFLGGTPQVGRAPQTTRYLECYGGIQTCSLRLFVTSGRSEVLKELRGVGSRAFPLVGSPVASADSEPRPTGFRQNFSESWDS